MLGLLLYTRLKDRGISSQGLCLVFCSNHFLEVLVVLMDLY